MTEVDFRSIESMRRSFGSALWVMPPDQRQDYLLAAPVLPGHLVRAKLYPTRVHMLSDLPAWGLVAELGTMRGHFAQQILRVCRPSALHVIDISYALFERAPLEQAIAAGQLVAHEGDGVEVLGGFPEHFFDWVYVDADHAYDSVRRDLAAAYRVVRPGGFIVCNDYTNWSCVEACPYGVMRAVNEFCIERQLPLVGFALEPHGYFDVVLHRPEEPAR